MAKDDEDHIMTGVYIGLGLMAAAGIAWATWRYVLSEDSKRAVLRTGEDVTRKAKRLAEDALYKGKAAARSAAHSTAASVKDAAGAVRERF